MAEACFTAIGRHHTPRAKYQFTIQTLHPAAPSEIQTVLQMTGHLGEIAQMHLESLASKRSRLSHFPTLFNQDNTRALLTYFLIVRALRLADQEATSQVSRKE